MSGIRTHRQGVLRPKSFTPLSVDDNYFAVSTTNTNSFSFTSDISPDEGDHVIVIISTQNNSAVPPSAPTIGGNAMTEVVANFVLAEHTLAAYLYEVGPGGLTNPDIDFTTTGNSVRTTAMAYDVSGTMTVGYKDHGSEQAQAGDMSFDVDVDEGGIVIGFYSYWGNTSNRTFTGLTNDQHATGSNVRYGNGHEDGLSNDDTYTVSCNNDNGQDNSILFVISYI